MAQAFNISEAPSGAGPQADRWAWNVCWLMFLATALNYMDRQAISLVREGISTEFGIGFQGFGWVLAAFQLSYAFFQLPAGYMADRWNVRWTYAGAVAWWSLAGMAAAFSPTLGALMVLRALLGVGESFNWPCALRVTGLILPPADRSLGNGIFNSGAAIGAVITPLTVPLLAYHFGWRAAFFVLGVLGFAWVALWLWAVGGQRSSRLAGRGTLAGVDLPDGLSRSTTRLPRAIAAILGLAMAGLIVASSAFWGGLGLAAVWWAISLIMFGLLLIARVLPESDLDGLDWARSLGEVVRFRRFWILVVVSISINVCWHFLVMWLPTYLKDDRGMSFLAGGMFSAIPFLAADAGNLGGGALTRHLAGRGFAPARARLIVMLGCGVLIGAGACVGVVRQDAIIIGMLAIMAFGAAAFMANYFAFCQEVSATHTGLIVGILGGLGNLLAAGFHPIAGWVKDTSGTFAPVFVLVALMPFVGLSALALGWGWGPEEARSR